jgi:hypothetical protein
MGVVFPGITKGGSKTYYDAHDIYRQAIGVIVPGEGDEDAGEAGLLRHWHMWLRHAR